MDKTEFFKQLIEKDNTNLEAWIFLGEEYLNQNKLSLALHAFSEGLSDNDPQHIVTVEKLLLNYLKSKDNDSVFSFEDNDQELNLDDDFTTNQNRFQVIDGASNNVVPITEETMRTITFDDIGGLENVKNDIALKIIKPYSTPNLFTKFRKKVGGGILLYGPPGCGKTFIARGTAGECGAEFYNVKIADILDPYIGNSERNVRDLFETARANKPAVLFIDEIDALGYSRMKSSSDYMRPVVDTLLLEMDSITSSTEQLLVMGATNMPWDVDSAFKRPGRFDKLLFIPPPDEVARQVIFQKSLHARPVSENIDYVALSKLTHLFSGADIVQVVENATEKVLVDIMSSGVERPIQMDDLIESVHNTTPSTLEWLSTVKNYIKYSNQSKLYSDVSKYMKKNRIMD